MSGPGTNERRRQHAPPAAEHAGLSDLDYALADWASRHGANALVARAFALAGWAVAQGHACVALGGIPGRLMGVAEQKALPAALAASRLVGGPHDIRPLIVDNNRLYLQRYYAYETALAQRLRQFMAVAPQPVACDRLAPGHGLFAARAEQPAVTDWQAVAAFVALRHNFAVISGGPGTGKTYTIVRLLYALVETALGAGRKPPLIALAAPTGKAAGRMLESVRAGLATIAAEPTMRSAIAETIPREPRTLHRLLGLTGATTRPGFDADNPLPHDVVIVDEASMVDLPMMAKLTAAVGPGARLVLLGDRFQLASVESGSVLAEICANAGSNRFTADQQTAAGALLAEPVRGATHALADHVVTLQTSRRFTAAGAIGRLAAAVNHGDAETAGSVLAAGHAGVTYHARSDAAALAALADALTERYAVLHSAVDPTRALAQLAGHCVLTAVRIGPAGSQAINESVTARLARRLGFDPNLAWYPGRPVIVTRNDYRTQLVNGDIGIALRDERGRMRVWFAGDRGPRAFLPSALPAHDSVYAMTVHKSQGSEFDTVTVVLPDRDVPVLTRELLYTGITRARDRIVVYARPDIVAQTIARRVTRVSGLAARLAEFGGQ